MKPNSQKHLLQKKPLNYVLQGEILTPPPCWLMRQAGRYLPEYQNLRQKNPDFLEFCLTPSLAVKATLQPLERFDLDAAIIFSDILVIPYALGQRVEFIEKKGPILEALKTPEDIDKLSLEDLERYLAPVYEALTLVKSKLSDKVSLIGFSGGPWTLAAYMLEGSTSRTFTRAVLFALYNPQAFYKLLNVLEEAVSCYLINQIKAGAEVLQIFESWAGAVPAAYFVPWVIKPTLAILKKVREIYPEIPIIGFPKGAGSFYLDYVKQTGVSAISLDFNLPLGWVRENLPPKIPCQGALDPYTLVRGGKLLEEKTHEQLMAFKDFPYIFNLGHGIIPETPPENVTQLLRYIKKGFHG